MLSDLIDMSDASVSDSEVFGSTMPKKVGDSWPINADAAARQLTQEGLPVKPEDISGTMRFDNVVIRDGRDYLQLSTDLMLGKIMDEALKKGEEMQFSNSTTTMQMSMLCPAVPLPGEGCVEEHSIRCDGQGANGASLSGQARGDGCDCKNRNDRSIHV